MTRMLIPALAASLLAAPAAYGAAAAVSDAHIGEKFEAERQIVDLSKEVYGESAVYDTSDRLPAAIETALKPREPLPDPAMAEPVPAELDGRLPRTEPGTQWARVGEHLVEVNNAGIVVTAIYDVLP